MRLKLLGPLELLDGDGSPVVISAPKRRAVLAALALDANRMVLANELLDFVWGDDPPQSARTALQVHISGIRKLLGTGMRLVTHEGGYRLIVPPTAVDALQFSRLVEQARVAERDETAIELLRGALDLWRGTSALADVPGGALRDLAAGRLAEARFAALESLAGHLIALGRGDEIVAELADGLRSDPLRESVVDKLIAGLAQVGRQADAIEIYHETRRGLRDELGVAPGRRLQETYHALLAGGLGNGAAPTPAVPAESPRDHVGPAANGNGSTRAPDSTAAIPAQLPRNVSSFVAREAELRWLLDRIAPGESGKSGVVLVVGQAGVGKTALAVRAAQQTGPDFPDGQLFVNLRGFDDADPMEPGVALLGFLRALGVPDSRVPESLSERSTLYRSLTAHRRMMVVLDNARSAAQVRPLLPGGSRNLVLITSRNRMDGLLVREGATLLTLHPLTETDSVRLLATVVGGLGITLADEPALRLVRLCAGLPLALRITASRVTVASTDEAIAALVDELSDEQGRLAALSTEDSDVSLRATLSSAYRGLPDDAAALFRLMGLHPGDVIDVHTVAALAGWTGSRGRQALSVLTAAHLLHEVTADRYEMHDLLRLYSRELATRELAAGERDATVLRLLHYYLYVSGTVRTAVTSGVTPAHYAATPPSELPRFPAEDDGLSWFVIEEPAMYGLLTAGRRGGHHRHVWQLADNLGPLYCRAGSTVRWASAMRVGLDAAEADGDVFGRSLLLWRWGGALRAMGRPDEALPVLRQAHALTTSIGDDPVRRFNVLRELGFCETQLNLFDDVHEHYGEARELAHQLGLPAKEAFILDVLAWTCARAGDPDRSRHYAELALDTLRTGDSGGGSVRNSARGLMLYNEADILRRLGRHAEALARLNAAHELVILAKDRRGEAGCLAAIGTVLALMGRDDEARQPLIEALALYTELACSDADDVHATLDRLTARQEARIAGRSAIG